MTWRLHIQAIEAKAFRTFLRFYSLFKSERLSANIKLTRLMEAMYILCIHWCFVSNTLNVNHLCTYWQLTIDLDWHNRPDLSSERAPPTDKTENSRLVLFLKKQTLVRSPKVGSTPRRTDWLTVSRKVTVTVTVTDCEISSSVVQIEQFRCKYVEKRVGVLAV
jgi:hypothetical protein